MSAVETQNEPELIRQLAKGDEKAFRVVYDLYRSKIASFAYLLTESADIADDILQEVFVRLWMHRSKLPDVHHFNAYLHTITRNLVSDAMKKQAKERKVRSEWAAKFPDQENAADEIIFSRENQRLLEAAVSQLSPQQQKVYRMSREKGLKNDEIAGELGITAMTVKNHLVNAMQGIREYFRSHPELILIIGFISQQ